MKLTITQDGSLLPVVLEAEITSEQLEHIRELINLRKVAEVSWDTSDEDLLEMARVLYDDDPECPSVDRAYDALDRERWWARIGHDIRVKEATHGRNQADERR